MKQATESPRCMNAIFFLEAVTTGQDGNDQLGHAIGSLPAYTESTQILFQLILLVYTKKMPFTTVNLHRTFIEEHSGHY